MKIDGYSDIEGQLYTRLLDFAADHGGTASLVLREDTPASDSAVTLFDELRAHSSRVERVSSWPGTSVGAAVPVATIALFALDRAARSLLTKHADSVFCWSQPKLPEDLAFYNRDGTYWFYSIAHEGQWDVLPQAVDVAALKQALPELEFWEG